MRFRVLNGPRGTRRPWQGTLALRASDCEADAAAAEDRPSPWLLMNLSGPAAHRLESDPALAGVLCRCSGPGQKVLLTDAQIDQVAGLINLRGGAPIELYATPSVFEDFTSTMPVLQELERHCSVHWHIVPVAGDRRSASFQVRGLEGLEFTAFDAGPAPEGAVGYPLAPSPGHSIAIGVRDRKSGRRAVFARGLGAMTLGVPGVLEGLDCLLVDSGLAADDEPLVGAATTQQRANAQQMLDWLSNVDVPRRVLLNAGSEKGDALLRRRGIEPGLDGVDIVV
jgi:pyrroloquinoline quinone biosynthesis protein B